MGLLRKTRILALVFVLLASSAPAHSAPDSSVCVVQAVKKSFSPRRSDERKIADVLSAIDGGFPGEVAVVDGKLVFKSWQLKKYPYPGWSPPEEVGKFRWMIDDILSLQEENRTELFRKLKKTYPNLEERVPESIRLAFDDPKVWLKYFDRTLSDPKMQWGYWMVDRDTGNLDQLEHLSPATQDLLLKRIAKLYPTSEKDTPGVPNGPKRQLDGWIRGLIRGDQIFAEEFEKSHDPVRAYTAYLNAINRRLIRFFPKNKLRYGTLKAKDILAFAQDTRKFMALAGFDHKNYVARDMYGGKTNYGQDRVLFHGSITKGLGKVGSDLDLGVPGKNAVDWGAVFNMVQDKYSDHPREPLPSRLRKIAQRVAPQLKLKMDDFEAHDIDDIMRWAPMIEPIMIEATAQEVRFLVFPLRDKPGPLKPVIYRIPAN